MSKVTREQIMQAAHKACQVKPKYGGIYSVLFANTFDEIQEDLEAAVEVNKSLPDCITSVSCRATGEVNGIFKFSGNFTAKGGKEVYVSIKVDRSSVEFDIHPDYWPEFLRLCAERFKDPPPEPAETYEDIVRREG
jgi:hypothetical protein